MSLMWIPEFDSPDVATFPYNRTEVLAGDWFCSNMNYKAQNYATRTSCYGCGALKNIDHGDGSCPPGWKAGDWICPRCGVHNYASRTECFKCKAQRDFALKNIDYGESSCPPGWKAGDWICPSCPPGWKAGTGFAPENKLSSQGTSDFIA
ncbi:hypothetical protein SLEP1_g13366 [Rubroshorea leprosula]|nr:hypothetical protein SLEP1_g13366 [Rubroshorea leprosula]